MRAVFALLLAALLPGLAACDRAHKAATVNECAAGFAHSADEGAVSGTVIRAACVCAVDRQIAAGGAEDLVDAGTPRERRAYRDHMPACLAANGGSATSTLARESQGPPHRNHIFDPATGVVTDPNPPLPPLPGMPGAVDGPAPAPLQAPPALAPGESRLAPVPVASATMAIVRNRSFQTLQCGRAGTALEPMDAGEYDVSPGHYYCAAPVQPPSFELRGGRTYDIGPFAGGELFVHDVTPAR